MEGTVSGLPTGKYELIGRYLESNLLGVKVQRNVLVANGNTDDFDSADHPFSSGVKFFSFAT
jgi:hypothetical protein